MKNSIFVYGPAGCGKTKNAEKIAQAYGMKDFIDNWAPGDPIIAYGHLILTQSNMAKITVKSGRGKLKAIPYAQVKKELSL